MRQRPEFDMFQEALSSLLASCTNLVLKLVSVAVGKYLYRSFTLLNQRPILERPSYFCWYMWKYYSHWYKTCIKTEYICRSLFFKSYQTFIMATTIKQKTKMATQLHRYTLPWQWRLLTFCSNIKLNLLERCCQQ